MLESLIRLQPLSKESKLYSMFGMTMNLDILARLFESAKKWPGSNIPLFLLSP